MMRFPKIKNTPVLSVTSALTALLGVGVTVVFVQGLSFLANLVVVRSLSVSEYAILTASLSIVGVLSAIADSGISQAAMTVGGLHHGSREKTAEILKVCQSLIRKTAFASLTVIVPVWCVLIWRMVPDMKTVVVTGVFLFGGFFVILGLNIYRSVLLLQHQRALIQRWDVIKTGLRLLVLVIAIHVFPSASFVIACGFAVEFICWLVFRRKLAGFLGGRCVPSAEIAQEIYRVFSRLMPAAVYRALSSQVLLLLLIVFGTSTGVAGAGALGKFHQFFIFIPAVVANILMPRLARMPGDPQRTSALIVYTLFGWGATALLCGLLFVFAEPLLHLFGTSYSNLVPEMRVSLVGSSLYTMSGILAALLATRGWIIPPALAIGSDVLFLAAAIMVCDVSILMGFVMMGCIVHGGALLTMCCYTAFCITRVPKRMNR